MGSSADNSSLDAIENGVVTLFSQRIMLLATGWSVLDILLVSAVAFTVKQRVWGVGSTMDSIVQGVVLKLILDSVQSRDVGLYLANLLCMFVLLHAFDASGFGSAAKYVFASEISGLFENNQLLGVGVSVVLQVNLGVLRAMPRLRDCAQLVATQLIVGWFQSIIPSGMTLPTTVLFVYLLGPLLTASSVAGFAELYSFAMYQISGAVQNELPTSNLWAQLVLAELLWFWSPDDVTGKLGKYCSVQAGCQLVLNMAAAEIRTDAVLATGVTISGLAVVLGLTSGKKKG